MNHELQEENPPLDVEKGRFVSLDSVSSWNLNFGIKVLWSTGVSVASPDCLFRWLCANGAYFTCRKCTSHDTPWTLKLFRTPVAPQKSVERVKRSVHMEKTRASADPETKLHVSVAGIRHIWDCFYCLTVSWCIATTTASYRIFGRPFATLIERNCVEASLHWRREPSHIWRTKYYRD